MHRLQAERFENEHVQGALNYVRARSIHKCRQIVSRIIAYPYECQDMTYKRSTRIDQRRRFPLQTLAGLSAQSMDGSVGWKEESLIAHLTTTILIPPARFILPKV